MLPTNSYLLGYNRAPITSEGQDYQPECINFYGTGQLWAEPDLEHAAELMQAVFSDPRRAGG